MGLLGRDECGMGTTEAHRDTEALRQPDRDVDAHMAGRSQQDAGEQVGSSGHEGARSVGGCDQLRVVVELAARTRPREQRAEACRRIERGRTADGDDDADRLGAGVQHRDGLRVSVLVDEECVAGMPAEAPDHRHRLRRGCCFIEQRSVGELETGEIGDHRLEIEDRLEPALADLGLIRRIRGVPGRILEHVAHDHGGSDGAVVAHPDQARSHDIAVGQLA